MLRHKEVSGTQKETRVEQLTQYEDQSALGFFFNSAPGYAQPRSGTLFSYIYIGFLPISISGNHQVNKIQGYKAGGIEFTFTNCDGNPNSYIALYFNVNDHSKLVSGGDNSFSNGWLTSAVKLAPSDYMPDRFYFANEMHMGGCGTLSTTRNLGGILGSLGLPFGKFLYINNF
jgi:hypothetical protein